jgi:hypothetical protein
LSPSLRFIGKLFPDSVTAPGPTAETTPSEDFFSSAPGRKRPPAVFSSTARRETRTRSPRGAKERRRALFDGSDLME